MRRLVRNMVAAMATCGALLLLACLMTKTFLTKEGDPGQKGFVESWRPGDREFLSVGTRKLTLLDQPRGRARERVLVFVHGVWGASSDTWLAKSDEENIAYFPELIDRIPEAEIFKESAKYVWGYKTPKFGLGARIGELGAQMAEDLLRDSVLTYDEIVVVAHSMGGLVAKELLLNERVPVGNKVRFMLLLGTPSRGSPWAGLASCCSSNPQLREMKVGSDYLTTLHARWTKRAVALPVFCVREGLPFLGPEPAIVSDTSAKADCYDQQQLAGDDDTHLTLPKPTNAQSVAITKLVNEYGRIADLWSAQQDSVSGTVTVNAPIDLITPLDPRTRSGIPHLRLEGYYRPGSPYDTAAAVKAIDGMDSVFTALRETGCLGVVGDLLTPDGHSTGRNLLESAGQKVNGGAYAWDYPLVRIRYLSDAGSALDERDIMTTKPFPLAFSTRVQIGVRNARGSERHAAHCSGRELRYTLKWLPRQIRR